jgi:glycosyltransferase involved in cell wall biosynthesis
MLFLAAMARIILSVINDLSTDQRVHRVASTLTQKGEDVTLVGRLLPGSMSLTRPYRTHRMRLLFRKSPLFYAEYNLRLFLFLLFSRVDILVSNDLDTLLANWLVSVIRRKKLVYDTHEYFTGMPEVQDRKIVQMVWRSIERLIFPKLRFLYTVNKSIAQLYANEYGKTLLVVRNVPITLHREQWPTRTDLGLPSDKKIVLLQGAGINMHRGAEEAIAAMQYLDNSILLIVGGGDVYEDLKQLVVKLNLEDKIVFKPKMPYEQLMGYTRVADIGLSLDKDTNINYRYSLPNKLFDYIQAGIPVLCSNLVEVAGIVNQYQIGLVAMNHEPAYLAQKMKEMLQDEAQKTWRINLHTAASELCWEKEETVLWDLYKTVLS